MKRLESIISLAKRIAFSIIKEKKIDDNELSPFFNESDKKEIVSRLNNSHEKKRREILLKKLKTNKKNDWKKIEDQVAPKSKYYVLKPILKVAAVFVGAMGITYLFYVGNTSNDIDLASNDIVLKLDNGNKEIISNDGTRTIIDKKGKVISEKNGGVLDYYASNEATSLKFNEITVPYGKTFQLLLSDSTKVYLNSGTTLKYPVKFLKNYNREVELTGEAFFEVYKDKKRPFIVKSNELNIKVLGTKFNVTSYPEDWATNTVLVEGAVSLYTNEKSKVTLKPFVLKPNQKASWINNKKTMRVGNVYDTSIYTAWIDGKIIFKHMKFKAIVKKLERHYNVEIVNRNKELSEKTFTARFDIETIEQVLNTFSKSYPINYTIEKKKIIIN
ncbi:FecR family protein [Wenyingzhuangia sp. IMCC45574]